MPDIELRNINKFICCDVNMQVRDGELLVLLGPNGSGKTTLLNIIAGLVDYGGSVLFNGSAIDSTDTRNRGVGYLFQELVLFPHLDVRANIAYGLKIKNEPRKNIDTRVDELLQLMKIEHLATRHPKHLSGGEKQRVALARALAVSPQVLLLDEPLSSLDAQTAKYLRSELKHVHRTLGLTTLYVTHNLEEAEEMADRVAVIHSGRVDQVGRVKDVFFSPENKDISTFIGAPNILQCDYCRNIGHGVVEVGCGGLSIIVPHDGNTIHKIAFFPRDIYISNTQPPGPELNLFKGKVKNIDNQRDAVRMEIEAGDNCLLSEVPHHVFENLELTEGQEIFLKLKLRRIRIYEKHDN
jgi:ABC-type sulfate/molybdate transport systems ATPase subunit